MNVRKFYPALHLGEFADSHTALQSVGVSGPLADLCVAGMDDDPGAPVAYEAQIVDCTADVKTVLVLAPTERGSVNLCYGYLDLAADSEEDALIRAIEGIAEDVASGKIEILPTFLAFQLTAPRRVLQ